MRYKFTDRNGQIGFGDSNHEAVSATGNDDTVAFKQRPDGRIAVWALIGHVDPVIKQPRTSCPKGPACPNPWCEFCYGPSPRLVGV